MHVFTTENDSAFFKAVAVIWWSGITDVYIQVAQSPQNIEDGVIAAIRNVKENFPLSWEIASTYFHFVYRQ